MPGKERHSSLGQRCHRAMNYCEHLLRLVCVVMYDMLLDLDAAMSSCACQKHHFHVQSIEINEFVCVKLYYPAIQFFSILS